MKRNLIFIIPFIFNAFNFLSAQSTEEIQGLGGASGTIPLSPSSISTWNNQKIISGKMESNWGGAFIKVDSSLSSSYAQREFYLDYACDDVSSSTALGPDLFAMTGTASDVSNGVYPRPYVVVVDSLFLLRFAFTIPDTSLNLQIHPKIASTQDGGFVLSWTAGNGEGRIVKFSHSGSFVWGHLLTTPGLFYVDDLVVKSNGEIIVAGRNPTIQGLQPALVTLDSAGQVLRAFAIREQQSEPVSIAISNNIAIAFCTADPLTTYNKLNIILFNQDDSILSGSSYAAQNCNYECTDLSMFSDTSWLITGNFFVSQGGWPEMGFYLKGSTFTPLINDSYIGDHNAYMKFFSSFVNSNGTIWTAGNQGNSDDGLIVRTALPVDDCHNLSFFSVAATYNPSDTAVAVTSQNYTPLLIDPHAFSGGGFTSYWFSCMSGINENTDHSFEVNVFPNPTSTTATFQLTGIEGEKTILVFNQLGQEIWRKESTENSIEFPAENFAAGLYFYRVEQKNNVRGSGKIVIQ